MKVTSNDEEMKYGIKYKVYKLDRNNFLLFPLNLIKGYEEQRGFKTDTEVIPYANNRQDLKNRFVADNIFDKEELEYVYDYEGEEDFLEKFFYEEHKNVIILVNLEDEKGITKIDLDYKEMADQSCDVVYCMDKSYPTAILNEKAIDELLQCEDKRSLEIVLKKYKELVKSFKDTSKKQQVTRIYVSDGKVEYIERLCKTPNKVIDKQIETILNEEMEKMDDEPITESGISYDGLRKYIKERVYGHDEAIDTFAQKIFMNYTANDNETVESILLVGPTGTGKTETVHAACEYLDLPSYEVNASNIVPQGIKGMSLEDVIIGLYENAGRNVKKAEKGIVFLDEFDKLNDTDLEIKGPVKNILLTFTAGGNFPIDNDQYKFNFNSARTTKVYAGVFDRISQKIKSMGFNSVLEFAEVLGQDEEIRRKIIDKKYFTLEELSRISTILAYNELDRETKKQILTSSKLSEFIKKRDRYKRQFKLDLIAREDYIDAILDTLDKDALGMRSINNYVKRTINEVEKSILMGETKGYKQLILTRDTVTDPHKFELS